jgi:hypothetical protein
MLIFEFSQSNRQASAQFKTVEQDLSIPQNLLREKTTPIA